MIAKVMFSEKDSKPCACFVGEDGHETPKCQSQEFALWFLKISVMRHACDEKIAESITEQVRKSNLPEKITESDRVAAQTLGAPLAFLLGAYPAFSIFLLITAVCWKSNGRFFYSINSISDIFLLSSIKTRIISSTAMTPYLLNLKTFLSPLLSIFPRP